ncbi:MAG: hypothetical protein QGH83_16510 [Candidatus Pacebacteria bacterium]|nr:hypothetical protein [Candidatus Paceibacterota bacterium]
MLLTEEQTEEYLSEMINRYANIEQDAVTSEALHKKHAFQDMRIILFGDDNGNKREKVA